MTSDEERHKVAQKLRVLACTPDEIGITEHAVIRDLGISAGIYDDCCKSEDVIAVADLIDPTCEYVPIGGERFSCSECGNPVRLDFDVPVTDETYMPFKHCPNCGAEVSSGE